MIPDIEIRRTHYGDLSPGRQDIRAQWALSLDLRPETGPAGYAAPAEDRWLEPGTVSLSLFTPPPDAHPVGEIRMFVGDVEVSVVGALTNRPGVVELTPDMVRSALGDNAYRVVLQGWLGAPAC